MENDWNQHIILHRLSQINWQIIFLALILSIMGIANVHSATDGGKTVTSIMHLFLGIIIMFVIALSPIQLLMRSAIPLYLAGVILLILVEFVGVSAKGAQRWLDLGFIRFQPSEIMKIAVPLSMAWIIHHLYEKSYWMQIPIALVVISIPFLLILIQPDLGTASLVFVSGVAVIFLAGLPWKVIFSAVFTTVLSLPIMWMYVLKPYQKNRVFTLIDPSTDPLGKGYHTIQSVVAVGSGGILGKGYNQGTQTQLNFLPEPHTDFAFAVVAEEWGLVGFVTITLLFSFIVFKGLNIALFSYTKFGRLLAGAFSITLFVYFFINIGMVIGILPIVGVPLPFISYGGTNTLITFATIGIILCCGRRPPEDDLIRPLM